METKSFSFTRKEVHMIIFALWDGIRARQELASNCRTASKSGVQTIENKEKWIEYAERAEKEMQEFEILRDKIRNEMYK